MMKLHDEVALPAGKSAGTGLDYFNNQENAGDIHVPGFKGVLQDQIEPLR